MDFLKDFDRAIKVLKKDAEGKPELLVEIEALEAKRPELVEALEAKNTRASMEIIEEAFRVGKKARGTTKGEPPGKGFALREEGSPEEELVLPNYLKKKPEEKPAEEAEPAVPEKESMEEWDRQKLKEIEEELKRIEEESEEIRGDWAKLEGIKGSYREITEKIKSIDQEVDRMVEDRRGLYGSVKKIKKEVDSIHTPSKAVLTQEAYDKFWNELLQVSVKLAEIEELLEKNERVTEIDLLELKKNVEGLARKLDSIEWVASKKKA